MPRRAARPRKQDREAQAIDVHVGQQVRQRRVLIGASQEQLGEHLGLTFQQVQKYEKGANRISAGRLLQIADFLGVRIESFFEGLALHGRLVGDDTDTSGRQRVLTFAMSREGRALNQVYLDAPHPRQRKIALDVLRLPTTPED